VATTAGWSRVVVGRKKGTKGASWPKGHTSISFVSSVDAAWNTSPGGDALRSAFFTSGSSSKLIRPLSAVLCDMEWMVEVLSSQEGKTWEKVVASLSRDSANKEVPFLVPLSWKLFINFQILRCFRSHKPISVHSLWLDVVS
jgi:hypothetical protein